MKPCKAATHSKTAQKQKTTTDTSNEPALSTVDTESMLSATELITDVIAEVPHAGHSILFTIFQCLRLQKADTTPLALKFKVTIPAFVEKAAKKCEKAATLKEKKNTVHLDKAKDEGKKRKSSKEIEELEEDSTEEIGGQKKRPKPAQKAHVSSSFFFNDKQTY